jgi:hypothetical protein
VFGGTYHLANPDPPPAGVIFDQLEELGYPLDRLTYEEWMERIDASPPAEGSPGEILRGATPEAEELWDGNTYDDRNVRRALQNGGPGRPTIDGELMETYVRFFEEQGWTEAPATLQEAERRA